MPDRPAGQEPELLTIVEAAELLRAPVATLRYWRHLGTGPRSFRLGRRVLYRADDLRSWIDVQHGRVANDRGEPAVNPRRTRRTHRDARGDTRGASAPLSDTLESYRRGSGPLPAGGR